MLFLATHITIIGDYTTKSLWWLHTRKNHNSDDNKRTVQFGRAAAPRAACGEIVWQHASSHWVCACGVLCVRTVAETGAFQGIVLECAFLAVFESFACVRVVMRNGKSAKEKMWWKQGRTPASGKEVRHHTFLHCACVCGGFYYPARTWLRSVCLEQCTFHGPLTHVLVLVQHLILQWRKMHVYNLQQFLKKREKNRINKREREGEHKYACARRARASEIELNGKSAKERGQDGKSERASFFVRVRVSIYPHARAQSLKHTHTRHLTCCFLSWLSFFFAHQMTILYSSNNKSLFLI